MRVDGSHGVHSDGKGNSGMFLTMGRGAMMNVSKKLGLMTISSIEIEVVADGERFRKCSWCSYVRIAQGGQTKEYMLTQDN